MDGAPFCNALYGINTYCYDLCNVRYPVVYSREGVVKRGTNHECPQSLQTRLESLKLEWKVDKIDILNREQ